MKHRILLPLLLLIAACTPKTRVLTILTTNDQHGAWFDSVYVGEGTRPSILAVNYYVDSIRKADGGKNVLLLDAGDCLQGDNAAYYYNYVDTTGEHLFSRIAAYMRYDAICLGNHDIETGHKVYDRVTRELAAQGIPFMSGNALRNGTREPYFPLYKVFKLGGLKILVLGYTNPNIPAWLDESLWSGMHFESLIPLVQKDADYLNEVFKPEVTIVCVHSGAGKGDGRVLENQALDLFKSLRGVDLVVGAHDHRQLAMCSDSIALLNAGSRAKYLGVGKISVSPKGEKTLEASLIKVDKAKADAVMRETFQKDYEAVKAFTLTEIGILTQDLYTREAYKGMCPYINLIHKVQLESSGAQISFAAPLSYNDRISAGVLRYNDLFTIYPFENQLFTLRLTGKEIKDYLEYSYGLWLAAPGGAHVLEIQKRGDPRYEQESWSFINPSYNFDSAAGLVYTVDLNLPKGRRVSIKSLADGIAFDLEEEYSVAMTSYRASGGGGLLIKGAGIPKQNLAERVIGRHKDMRESVRELIERNGAIDASLFSGSELGSWEFLNRQETLAADYELLFSP